MSIVTRTIRPTLEIDAALETSVGLRITVHRGELVLGRCVSRQVMTDLTALAAGMRLPATGEARFMSEDWSAVAPDRAAALRGMLGLLRTRRVWVNHLTVLQNLMLAPLHHESRPRVAIAREAAALCRFVGLPGAPVCRPDQLTPDEQARADVVRAFIGDRRMVMLEEPAAELIAPVVNLSRELCRRGGAVLWLTTSRRLWREPPFAARRVLLGRRVREAAA